MQYLYISAMKAQRRRALISSLLSERPVKNQWELLTRLAEAGSPVTQATVSRDLAAMGAVRGPEGYSLPGPVIGADEAPPALAADLVGHALQVREAGTLLVLRTAPGHANIVAVALDRARLRGVIGTLAGDDTVFVATPSRAAVDALRRLIEAIIRGSTT